MLTKDRMSSVLKLALPITVALGASFIMVIIDLAMIGTLGNAAVAAVGLSSFSNSLVIAFVIGVSPAVQGIVARRRGEGSTEPRCLPLNAGLLLVLIIGAPLSVACYFSTPLYFSVISSDPSVIKEGVSYLRALYTAITGVGISAAFQGYWNGIGKAKIYMLIILFANCLNIFLNYVLIFGNFGAPALGTLGAGIASAISIYTGAFIYFIVTYYHHKNEGFLRAKPGVSLLLHIFRIGLPATGQEFFFSLGYVTFFWMVGQLGTAELAAANVLVRVTLVLILFAMALGMTSATLVSNAVGRGDIAGATQWGWDIGKMGVIWLTILGFPLFLFPEWSLSQFLSDPDTISMAVIPMRLTGLLTGIASLIYIFAFTLISLGDGKRVFIISFSTQWIFFLPAVWIVGPHLDYGILEIWIVQVAYGLMGAILLTAIWSEGRWKKIRI